MKDDHLWKKDPQGHHKLVIEPNKHPTILISAHNKAGHHRDFATCTQIIDHFWWPDLAADVAWFVKTCHLCQLHQTCNILILPVIATPTPLFTKMYMDTLHLLKSGGFKYLVQGHCLLTHYPKYHILHTKTAKTISDWIFEDIFCWWGALCEIVTDNGPAFVKALDYLGKCYHICHIWISGYNSRVNGIVERTHFNIHQALFKACDGDQSKWHSVITSVMWADRVTVHRHMGCSPYFTVTETHPLLPLDITEATYLLPPPDAPLLTTNLIATHAVALQKWRAHLAKLMSNVYSMHIKAAICFKQELSSTITNYYFKLGDLVLIWNTAIEKSLNCKMRTRYIGPLIVILQNRGSVYIISELNGLVFNCPIAAFHVIPYFAWQCIDIPPLDELIDITLHWLRELEETMLSDLDNEDEDLAANLYPSPDEDNDDKDWGQSILQLGGEILGKFFKFLILMLLRFCSFFAVLLLHLCRSYDLVGHERGFTGYEAFWAFPLLKNMLFCFERLIF